MAERRMFAKTIVLSDAFLDMPMSARCLYFTLGMLADDDGFVNAPRSIMRQCGASEDDMRVLIAKKFVLEFESGVIVIKHWRINNYLRNDRYVVTKYVKEKSKLTIDEKGGYHLSTPICTPDGIPDGIPVGIPNNGIPSIGKDSIGKDNMNTSYPSDTSYSCVTASATPAKPPIITMPCIKGETYEITEDDLEKDKEAYPAVDVQQEYKRIKRWLETNKSNLKTKRGMPRFINNWLSSEQNKGKKKGDDKSDANSRGHYSGNTCPPRTVYDLKPHFAGESDDGNA